MYYRIIAAISKKIIALSGAVYTEIVDVISIDKPTNFRIVITALEVIQPVSGSR